MSNSEELKTVPSSTAMCPICGKAGPHNHSIFEVEAFHRANENSARHFSLVTFTVDEIRALTARRANGINDRADSRWHP